LKSSYLIIAVFLLITVFTISQTLNLSGKSQDSLQNAIANTKMIATPLVEEAKITFAISSLGAEYGLKF
jgi:hypothetical protein